jgi:hypothetical protein
MHVGSNPQNLGIKQDKEGASWEYVEKTEKQKSGN